MFKLGTDLPDSLILTFFRARVTKFHPVTPSLEPSRVLIATVSRCLDVQASNKAPWAVIKIASFTFHLGI